MREGNPQVCWQSQMHLSCNCWEDTSKGPVESPVHLHQTGMDKRQLQEKYQYFIVDIYMTFVDPTKAFDAVNRVRLWKIMVNFDCSPRFIAMVRQFHDGMPTRIHNDGKFSEPFLMTNWPITKTSPCNKHRFFVL